MFQTTRTHGMSNVRTGRPFAFLRETLNGAALPLPSPLSSLHALRQQTWRTPRLDQLYPRAGSADSKVRFVGYFRHARKPSQFRAVNVGEARCLPDGGDDELEDQEYDPLKAGTRSTSALCCALIHSSN